MAGDTNGYKVAFSSQFWTCDGIRQIWWPEGFKYKASNTFLAILESEGANTSVTQNFTNFIDWISQL